MKYTTITAIAALATTTLAGTMTAKLVDRNPTRGLDPLIVDILRQSDAGTLSSDVVFNDFGLKPRTIDKTLKPLLGVQRDDTRLQIKFADALQVRLQSDGQAYSRTSRAISTITDVIEEFHVTLTPCIPASEARVDSLMQRAEQRSGKQTPDLGGMYWIDGNPSAVASAASVLYNMDEVEWVFWNTVFDPAKHTSSIPSIFSDQSKRLATGTRDSISKILQTQAYEVGACMIDNRSCEENLTNDTCRALGGVYLGDRSICEVPADDRSLRVPAGACCFLLLTGTPLADPPNGFLGVPSCLDFENDGITLADCLIIGTDPFSASFDGDVIPPAGTPPPPGSVVIRHGNGVWFDEEDCDGISTDCAIVPPGGPPGAFQCGEDGEPGSVFSGDCYHDQSTIGWSNRMPLALFPPATNAPGCWDAGGFPDDAPTGFEAQGCCDDVSSIDPYCSATLWDAECASLANALSAFGAVGCGNRSDLGGLTGDCGSPWGPNVRPYPTTLNGLDGTQRQVWLNDSDVIEDRTIDIPFVGSFLYGCGSLGETATGPGASTFTHALTSSTPDYFTWGLIPHLTDEALTLSPLDDFTLEDHQPLLMWPMVGARVGDSVNFTEFDVPVTSFRGATRWSGNGLNLFADQSSPSGIGQGDPYSGLYGLGLRKQDETGIANGTYGLGVKVAVLDYAAFLQTYTDTTGTVIGGIHEDLTDVLLEGTATGHDDLQMLFNPPDAPDYPFDFAQSPNHGTAQLGVIAASWNGAVPSDAIAPTGSTNTGAMGIVPEATVAFFPLIDLQPDGGTGGRVDTAWFNAMEWLGFGDVMSAGYVGLENFGSFPNLTFNPATHTLIETATNLGISVVIAGGDVGVDLSTADYPNGIDPGAISVCAVAPGTSGKRWADSASGSNFIAGAIDIERNTCAAWGASVLTCGMGPGQDNWLGYKTIDYIDESDPVEVAGRSYTNNYSGTSAAAAIVAGCVAGVQGYAKQVFDTPISPSFARLFIAQGQVAGSDPVTGDPILVMPPTLGATTEVDRGTTVWNFGFNVPNTFGWDLTPVVPGTGNIVGYLTNPRSACIRLTVDPIFDHPNVQSVMVLRGTYLQGAVNAIASQDGVTFGINSIHTPIGVYSVPAVVPGGSVGYHFAGETTDLYVTGIALDTRGNPLLTLRSMTFQVNLIPTQPVTTLLQLWMWDFIQGKWTQPSPSAFLPLGSTDQAFEIIRASNLLSSTGRYHARFVSISGAGPLATFPIYYDQIRLEPAVPSIQP